MKSPHQRGQNVGIFGVKIIVGTVQIRRHGGNSIEAVLGSVSLAHFNTCDLCNGIPFIGRLQGTGQERAFGNGLRSKFRINTGGSEEEDFFDAVAVRGINDVSLDLEVDGNEIGWIRVVSVDSADFCGC